LAVLRDLANLPCGPDRTKACGARRQEILKGISQVRHVLDETDQEAAPQDVGQRRLFVGRLAWATDMTAGLQQAAVALRLLEQADLMCENSCAQTSFMRATWSVCQPAEEEGPRELPAEAAAEYKNISLQLAACNRHLIALTSMVAGAAPREVAKVVPDDNAQEIFEGLWDLATDNVGNICKALCPVMRLIELVDPGAFNLTVTQGLPRGVPKPRSPFP